MNNDAATESGEVTAVPSLVGLWTFSVDSETDPKLKELDQMDITFQVPGLLDTPLYGSVNSVGPYTSHFAMVNAMFDGGVSINFEITMLGTTYVFEGTVTKGIHMSGVVTGTSDPESKVAEEGSWSAQAQGGGDEYK
jgi:hypothetical protein